MRLSILSFLFMMIVSGCSTLEQTTAKRKIASDPACVHPTRSCRIGEPCRPDSSISLAETERRAEEIFRSQSNILFLVQRLANNQLQFVNESAEGNPDRYFVWSDTNSDGIVQNDELKRPPILEDFLSKKIDLHYLQAGVITPTRAEKNLYYEVDTYGNSIMYLKPWSSQNINWVAFQYFSRFCDNTEEEKQQVSPEVAP